MQKWRGCSFAILKMATKFRPHFRRAAAFVAIFKMATKTERPRCLEVLHPPMQKWRQPFPASTNAKMAAPPMLDCNPPVWGERSELGIRFACGAPPGTRFGHCRAGLQAPRGARTIRRRRSRPGPDCVRVHVVIVVSSERKQRRSKSSCAVCRRRFLHSLRRCPCCSHSHPCLHPGVVTKHDGRHDFELQSWSWSLLAASSGWVPPQLPP